MSIAPFSSRNSARWKPSGSFSRTVCSITRGPAKPISAFGSAITTSPSMAKLADTPPMVGSVSTRDERQAALGQLRQRRGGLGHLHQREQALLHARAAGGGEAHERHVLLDRGVHAAHEALADHRAHRAAHEVELEAAATSGTLFTAPCITTSASVSPVSFSASSSRSGYLRAVLELQGVDRRAPRARSRSGPPGRGRGRAARAPRCGCGGRTSGRRSRSSRGRSCRAPPRTPGTCSTGPRAPARFAPVGALDLRGQQLLQPAHAVRRYAGFRAIQRRADPAQELRRTRRPPRVGPRLLHLLDQPAADDHRVGDRADRARRLAVADAEAHADRQRGHAPDARQLRRRRRRRRGAPRRSRP